MGRRLVALLIDWLISYGLALLALGVGAISESGVVDRDPGHLVRAGRGGGAPVRLHAGPVGAAAAGGGGGRPRACRALAGRLCAGLLIALVVPPLFIDSDGRGMQDRLTGTAVLRR